MGLGFTAAGAALAGILLLAWIAALAASVYVVVALASALGRRERSEHLAEVVYLADIRR